MARRRFKPKMSMIERPRDPLSAVEIERFEACTRRVINGFFDAGMALAEIKRDRFYRHTHQTFEEYCSDVLDMSQRRAEQLIEASEVLKGIESAMSQSEPMVQKKLPTLTNERQARELIKVPQAERVKVIQKAAEKTGGKVTAKAIKQAAKEHVKAQPPPPPTKSEGDPLKPHVRAAFDSPEFDEILKMIRQVGERIGILSSEGLGSFFAKDGKGAAVILSDLRRIWEHVSACKPHSDCVYCCQRCDGCDACKEQGWITKQTFDHAPLDLQRRSKVIKK